MPTTEMETDELRFEIANIGGIESGDISIPQGITVLSGENATNRTSLLYSIMAACGSSAPSIRAGTDRGYVSLETGTTTVERTVTATESGYYWDGEGLCEEQIELLDLYAFLVEDNQVRQTVASGGDLRDVVMDPVDVDEIEAEIQRLQQQKREIEQDLESLDAKRDRRQRIVQTVEDKQQEVAELEAKKDELQKKIDESDLDIEQHKEFQEKSDDLNADLRDVNREMQSVERDIETLEQEIKSRKDELEPLKQRDPKDTEELEAEADQIGNEIESLRSKQADLKAKQNAIKPLRHFLTQVTNESSISEINSVLNSAVEDRSLESTDEDVFEILTNESGDTCILCGGEIEPGHYDNVNSLTGEIIKEINGEISQIDTQINSKTEKRDTIKTQISDEYAAQSRRDDLERGISERESRLEEKQERLDELQADADAINDRLDEIELNATSDKIENVVKWNREHSRVESDLVKAKETIESQQNELGKVESEIEELEAKDSDVAEIDEKIEDQKQRVERIESEIISQFNEHIEEVLSELEFTGIERIWLEKQVKEVKEGRRKVEKPVFNLNIVRDIDGTATGGELENLSESEREVTGLILALAGFIVYDVHDACSIMVLDSVEMIDATRLEKLLEYISEYIDYLVVAALPEDVDVIDLPSQKIQAM